MTTLRSADELRKQGLYFEYTPDPTSDTTRDTPTPITPPAIRPRTAQACDKCRERKTKVRCYPLIFAILPPHDPPSVPARGLHAFAARDAGSSATTLPG